MNRSTEIAFGVMMLIKMVIFVVGLIAFMPLLVVADKFNLKRLGIGSVVIVYAFMRDISRSMLVHPAFSFKAEILLRRINEGEKESIKRFK